MIATSLIGRWAKGAVRDVNPAHVPWDFEKHHKIDDRTPMQRKEFIWTDVVGKIVAVDSWEYEHSGRGWYLRIWVLIDGEIRWLDRMDSRVMPEGWEPEIPR